MFLPVYSSSWRFNFLLYYSQFEWIVLDNERTPRHLIHCISHSNIHVTCFTDLLKLVILRRGVILGIKLQASGWWSTSSYDSEKINVCVLYLVGNKKSRDELS
jgi:hypothetical protein